MNENIYFPLSGAGGGGSGKIVQFEPDSNYLDHNCIEEKVALTSIETITVNGLTMYKYMGMIFSSSQIRFENKEFYDSVKNTDKPFIIPTTLTVNLYAPESTTTVLGTVSVDRNIVYYYADKYVDGDRDMRLFRGKTSYKLGLSSFDIEVELILQKDNSGTIDSLYWGGTGAEKGTLVTYSTNVKIEGLYFSTND